MPHLGDGDHSGEERWKGEGEHMGRKNKPPKYFF